MFSITKVKRMLIVGLASGALLLSVGCGWKANEEQIRQMEETRSAALSAEQKLEDLKQQNQQKQEELAAKKKELEQVKAAKEAAKQRVDNWGN